MVSRDDCIVAINNFIKEKSHSNMVTLFNLLCEVKEATHYEQEISKVINSTGMMAGLGPRVLEELINTFKLTAVTDRGYSLVLVF